MTDDDLPTLFTAADSEAVRAQRRLFRLTAALLAGAMAAAIFGSFSIEHAGLDLAAIGSLLGLAGGLSATYLLGQRNPNRHWYDFRALAESSKSLSWLYAVGGGDFEIGARPEDQSRSDFLGRLRKLREQLAPHVPALQSDPVAITDPMARSRGTSLDERRDSYRANRLTHQLHWYRRRSNDHVRSAAFWGRLSFVCQSTGFLFAALRLFEVVKIDLVGIATTAAVSAAAWLRSHDHSGIAEAYRQTAFELSEIEATIGDPTTEAEWATWTANAETAMSREHTSWRARRRHVADGA